ncbi:MAG: hypothetical protein V4643_15105 [Bacteroidota bacterium]
MEKTDEIYGEGNAYDFGERIYDSRLGKMFKRDPYYSVYPGLSPYSGMAGNPISNIDTDGKLILFVSGFGLGRRTTPMHKLQNHWDVQFRKNVAASMDDYKAMYFTGSSKTLTGVKSFLLREKKKIPDVDYTSAATREDEGREAITYEVAMVIKQQLDAQRASNPNAKINVVAHSMGCAKAAGMVEALLSVKDENGNHIFSPADFGETWLIAAYQPDRIFYPQVGTVTQLAHDNDKIAGNIEMRTNTKYKTTVWGNGNISKAAHASITFLEYFKKWGSKLPEIINRDGSTTEDPDSEKPNEPAPPPQGPPIKNPRSL